MLRTAAAVGNETLNTPPALTSRDFCARKAVGNKACRFRISPDQLLGYADSDTSKLYKVPICYNMYLLNWSKVRILNDMDKLEIRGIMSANY